MKSTIWERIDAISAAEFTDQDEGRSCKKVKMEVRSVRFLDLPTSIQIDILGRLPLKTLVQCKYVCKSWHAMLGETYFHKQYAVHTPTTLILQVKGNNIDLIRELCLIEPDEEHSLRSWEFVLNSRREFRDDVPTFKYQLGNSCHGLICVRELKSREPMAICNPLMGQYVMLPRPISVSDDKTVAGFGFCNRTNRYKVIRVFHEKHTPRDKWATELYDFGNGIRWRRIRDAPCAIPSRIPGFFFGRSLHWILDSSCCIRIRQLICSFNFVDEDFHSIPPPPIFSPDQVNSYHWSNLGILRGCLSICAIDSKVFRPDFQVWVMEEYNVRDSWVKKLSIRDPAVDWWDPYRWIQVTNHLDSGEILMLCGHRYVLAYDAQGRGFREIQHVNYPAIAHVPTFMPLDAILNENGPAILRVRYL